MSVPVPTNAALLGGPQEGCFLLQQDNLWSWRDERWGGPSAREMRRTLCDHCQGWSGQQGKHYLSLIASSFYYSCSCYTPQPLLLADTQAHSSRTQHQMTQSCCSSESSSNQGQLCHAGGTKGHAGQQNIKSSKLFSDYFVYCASGFWLGGVVILSSLPWAVKAIKAFVLDWHRGKSDRVLALFLHQVCQVVRYVWHSFTFFPLSPHPSYST